MQILHLIVAMILAFTQDIDNDLYHLDHGAIGHIYGVLRRVNGATVRCQNGWMGATRTARYIHGDHASETRLRLDRGRFTKIVSSLAISLYWKFVGNCINYLRQSLNICSVEVVLFVHSNMQSLKARKIRAGPLRLEKLENRHHDNQEEGGGQIKAEEAEPFQKLSEELYTSTWKDPYCEDSCSSG